MNSDIIIAALILFGSCTVSAVTGAYFAIKGYQKAILEDALREREEQERKR